MTYNAEGKRTSLENLAGLVTTTAWNCCLAYGYNEKSELTNAVAAVDSDYRYSYAFDDIGNRETSTERGTNSVYSANQLNQYCSVTTLTSDVGPQTSSFSPLFDDDGNQTLTKTSTGIWSVTYNGENRPVLWECVSTNSPTPNSSTPSLISMSYDRMGSRVEYVETTDVDGAAITNAHHSFVYDGYLCIQRLNAAANNSIDLIFAWDPAEPVATRPLMIEKPGKCMLHVTHDGNKNVTDLVFFKNGSGVAAHYEYAPFGALAASTRNSMATIYDFRTYNPFRFSSEYADDTLGLVYYNYRHYEPMRGRWLSRDCLQEKGGFNLYVFAENSVPVRTDVLGLRPFAIEIQMPWASQAIRAIREMAEKINAAKEKIRQAVACMDSIRRAFARKENGMYDKLNHCISSCEIANDCGHEIALALGVIKEIRDLYAGNIEWVLSWILPKEWEEELHEIIQGGDFEASSEDFRANFVGFDCRNSPEGCECCCNKQHGVSFE